LVCCKLRRKFFCPPWGAGAPTEPPGYAYGWCIKSYLGQKSNPNFALFDPVKFSGAMSEIS